MTGIVDTAAVHYLFQKSRVAGEIIGMVCCVACINRLPTCTEVRGHYPSGHLGFMDIDHQGQFAMLPVGSIQSPRARRVARLAVGYNVNNCVSSATTTITIINTYSLVGFLGPRSNSAVIYTTWERAVVHHNLQHPHEHHAPAAVVDMQVRFLASRPRFRTARHRWDTCCI